ncbi:MAG: phosphate ABC transporter substrate-binding protein PstS [Chloroflexi bacterium]|nr:phosphate ABC transporter substrate-binding protein PstS [Chloroflexota bacterium]
MLHRPFSTIIVILAILLLTITACGKTSSKTATVRLNGAGATFPFPLYSKWFDEYAKLKGVKVNYQSIGSGGGIRQITEDTVDFGASDGIMTTEEQKRAEDAHGPILHIPMTMGAVTVVFNLPGITAGQLKLTSDVLADIYLKKITKWNDPQIAQINQGINLPNQDIAVVHRSDGSGTTFIFTNYLAKVSQEWKDKVGNATSVKWPGDIGGQGNEGVAGQVRQIGGAIGYVELAYATQNKMAWAALKNAAGNFIEPTLEATSKAAEGVTLPDDMKVMITNSSNPQAYPIAGFTWVLVYQKQTDCTKGKALVDMLQWAIHDGQKYAAPLQYAALPIDAVSKAESLIRSITCDGQPLLK